MTSHVITLYDSHQTIYNNRNYVHTTYSSTRTNQLIHPYLTTLPKPSIKLCENVLYENKITEDVGSATSSSSYINSSSEHYDNAYLHTYDNPFEYLENYNIKENLINLPHNHENLYDNTKDVEIIVNDKSQERSPILFCLKHKSLALYACLMTLLLLLIITIGIFLLNKFIDPVVIHSTVNNHYDTMNISTTSITSLSTLPVTTETVVIDNIPFPYSTCPSDRWGIGCKNICKPCGLGVCHSFTGKCICPMDIYGEFCDLWKVNDKPKRGDMMS